MASKYEPEEKKITDPRLALDDEPGQALSFLSTPFAEPGPEVPEPAASTPFLPPPPPALPFETSEKMVVNSDFGDEVPFFQEVKKGGSWVEDDTDGIPTGIPDLNDPDSFGPEADLELGHLGEYDEDSEEIEHLAEVTGEAPLPEAVAPPVAAPPPSEDALQQSRITGMGVGFAIGVIVGAGVMFLAL